jgi:hypothetical protein
MTRTDREELAGMAAERAGWRSHTFADGVRSLTLVAPLDVALAGRLWSRIAELIARGTRRLIVDASAIDPTGDEPALLAAVLAGQPASCHTIVVAPAGSAPTERLPASVGVALTLTDAHHQLASGLVRQARRPPAAPGSRMPADERHALATRQSWRWAQRAAREGDYERALGWLQLIERIDGRLPPAWSEARATWTAAWTEAAATDASRRSSRAAGGPAS